MRKRLYQYGFTPYIGRVFEAVQPAILDELRGAVNYSQMSADQQLSIFLRIGELIRDIRGVGFRVRASITDQNILQNWSDVLGWWMQTPGRSPEPQMLRHWQRFVSDNIEFRLGVAIGAVVARAWSAGAGPLLDVPNLATWQETARLPWFAFWAKELLRCIRRPRPIDFSVAGI